MNFYLFIYLFGSADFVANYQLRSCRLDCSDKWNHVWSYKSIKTTSEQANPDPARAERVIPESLPVFCENTGQAGLTFHARPALLF